MMISYLLPGFLVDYYEDSNFRRFVCIQLGVYMAFYTGLGRHPILLGSLYRSFSKPGS